jgi:predicted enzyme related to lactoylglutathione lyase
VNWKRAWDVRVVFCRYSLRTTDLEAARAFYAEALGLVLPEGMSERSLLEAWPLHERALARGAPPHWLGHLAVDDVEVTMNRLVALGGERLGPTVQAGDGTPFATLRDPFGAVIAVRARSASAAAAPVVWHQLHTREVEGAWALYHELFGWTHEQTLDVPDPVGGYRLFAWNEAGAVVGSMGNTARWPGVHTHWLFFLPVHDLDDAAARVRALGGTAMEPVTISGMRLVGCEDPQGAAFGLAQSWQPESPR